MSRSYVAEAPKTNVLQIVALAGGAALATTGLALFAGLGLGAAVLAGWLGGPVLAAAGAVLVFGQSTRYDAPEIVAAKGHLRLVVSNAAPERLSDDEMRARAVLDWEQDRLDDAADALDARFAAKGDSRPAA